MLIKTVTLQNVHGRSHEIEVLLTVYCLVYGASYRVTSDTFNMPFASVCRTVHDIVEELITIFHKVIHFPKAEEMKEVGAGFARLACNEAFGRAAGPFTGSPMYQQALFPPAGDFLLGDGGDPCLQHPIAILTPYRRLSQNQFDPEIKKKKINPNHWL
ncbi:hypothetical protein E1301_Tti023413 [Triplophysa tibetana]|uniref:Uncharacterized protein n=1 Tax=Triplophysa tibetana TaxID=1572043 RepID=A0A5A9NBJ2_9TELE|nr:hypothetical protein E1301_Tti023413 [Triplophysa tibetana]